MVGKRLTLCMCAIVLVGLAAATSATAAKEPFFPRAGNPGYDVSRYDVSLAYRPGSGRLGATARIAATARQRLSKFSLDLDGLRVSAVTVDGEPAEFSRGRDKLKIDPRTPPRAQQPFTVVVRYHGRPQKVIDEDGSPEGWYRTADGAIAVGEPQGTPAWLPCNNVPADKAAFEIALTVPERLSGIANGRLVGVSRKGGRRTFEWRESRPMSTYLAVVDIGRGKLERGQIGHLPTWSFFDPALAEESRRVLARLPEIIHFESGIFGPYPFDSAGSIADVAELGYALETQSRPIYAFAPDLTTVVHETAHQWFGDSVGLQRWPNIWLNEGFATWTEWYYAERHGGRTAAQIFRRLYRVPASNSEFWEPPSGHPGEAENLFATSTYVRGGMTLEALRSEIGTKRLLKLLRVWSTQHRYASANIEEFIALAEEISGRQLDGFFMRWLFRPQKPAGFGKL